MNVSALLRFPRGKALQKECEDMTSVYCDADFLAVYKQRKKIIGVFLGITFAYLAFCVAWLIYFISLPYDDPMQALPKACVSPIFFQWKEESLRGDPLQNTARFSLCRTPYRARA